MSKFISRVPSACMLFALLASGQLFAQMTVTGSIEGTVTDPTGNVVVGAKVTLTSEKTGESRNATSNGAGAFSFVAVQPDQYSIRVEQSGFKAAQRTNIVLSANEHLSAGSIVLQIGQVTETISVVSQAAHVE